MQTSWICPSEVQRFCKNNSDSSLESLIVARVKSSHSVKNLTRVDLSRHRSQSDSSRVRVTKNRDSSRIIDTSHDITVNCGTYLTTTNLILRHYMNIR